MTTAPRTWPGWKSSICIRHLVLYQKVQLRVKLEFLDMKAVPTIPSRFQRPTYYANQVEMPAAPSGYKQAEYVTVVQG